MRISRAGPRGPWTAHDAHVLALQQLLASARRVARTGVLLTPTACRPCSVAHSLWYWQGG
jgi:hypothetical protein